ncbi:hypothetical protein ACLOJK_031652 [Asimina triloba]
MGTTGAAASSAVVSGFLPSDALVRALVHASNEVASMDHKLPPRLRGGPASKIIHRIRLLSSLFEELRENNAPISPSTVLSLTELLSAIGRARLLIQDSSSRSALWSLLQLELVGQRFHALEKDVGRALEILPLGLLHLTEDVIEQVGLLRKHLARADHASAVDPRKLRRKAELLQLMKTHQSERSNGEEVGAEDRQKLKEIVCGVGVRSLSDCEEEIRVLEAEIYREAGTGGVAAVSSISNLISILVGAKSMLFAGDGESRIAESTHQTKAHGDSTSHPTALFNAPNEFLCPISMELMRDPVIVASGHTYDRSSIAQWIDSGRHTCPKSGQKLIHMALIPNYALKSLINQWCKDNNVPLTDPFSASSLWDSGNGGCSEAVDHISIAKSAVEAVKMMADFLVGKLAMGSPEIQRQASYELRLLAKSGMDNRRLIADAGAIPFLVTLLGAGDPRTQENAVTALLNLSIFGNNKLLIMEAGAIDGIVEVLERGASMEARENASATIFSLSMVDECKLMIGARPRAIPGLVRLLEEGTAVGKRDAAVALLSLAVYDGNRAAAVAAGAVSVLIGLLTDERAEITDDALALLGLLAGCGEGLKEMRENRKWLVGILVDLMRFGSPKGKETAVVLLLRMCRNNIDGEESIRCLQQNPFSIASLGSLVSEGIKASRKADTLLRLLNRYCLQQNQKHAWMPQKHTNDSS